MQHNTLASLGEVNAPTHVGGGIGQVWGETTREEANATVRAAQAAGVTFFDMAPITVTAQRNLNERFRAASTALTK